MPLRHQTNSYAARILRLLNKRDPGKTICPSEILAPHLKKSKPTMQKVRDAAEVLRRSGEIEILRGGEVAEPGSRGPIRLRLVRAGKKSK